MGRPFASQREAAGRQTVWSEHVSKEALEKMKRRYFLESGELKPRVYYRLTQRTPRSPVRRRPDERGGSPTIAFVVRLALGVGLHRRIVGDVDPDVDVRLAAEVPDE